MKIHRIVVLSLTAVLVFPQLAGAELAMTPQALGIVEGILTFCTKAVPDSASKFNKAKEPGSGFLSDATKEELEKVRSSGEYLDAYGSTTESLNKLPKEEAVKACTDFLSGKSDESDKTDKPGK
jgi:hypothetical protein